MQYKIPIQLENPDTIFLGLSLKQIGIIALFFGIGIGIFKTFEGMAAKEFGAIFGIFIFGIGLFIALFKYYGMTFLPFLIALLRYNINYKERLWNSGVDSFNIFEIGIVVDKSEIKKEVYDTVDIEEKKKLVEENLSKI